MLHIRASLCHISCFGHGLSSRQAALSVYAPFGYAQGTTQPPPAYFSARLLCRSGFGRFCFLVAINQGNKKRPCVISVAYIKAKIFCVCHTYIVCTPAHRSSSQSRAAHPRSARRWLAPQRSQTVSFVPHFTICNRSPTLAQGCFTFFSAGNLLKAVLFFCFFYLKIKNE